MSERKPLNAQLVGKINADAMKALTDVRARAKWGDSNSGSPVSTNMLCAEIARLNLERAVMLAALRANLAFAEHKLELREPSADPDYIKYAKEAVETARVAIAAATGGTP